MPIYVTTISDGPTAYAVLGRNTIDSNGTLTNEYYNTVSGEFVDGLTNTFSWTASAIGLSSGTGDHFFGTIPDVPQGQYWIETWRQVNASPSASNDEIIGLIPVAYDGVQEIDQFLAWSKMGEILTTIQNQNDCGLTDFQDKMLRITYARAMKDLNNNNRSQ